MAFILCNPSTADEQSEDPTLRRCIGFARRWGFDALEIANCFALRSPRPADLRRARDPVGPDTDRVLRAVARRADRLVVGWGNHGRLHDRATQVTHLLADHALWCLGRTQRGQPRHPLYVPGDTRLRRFGQ